VRIYSINKTGPTITAVLEVHYTPNSA